jgi:hypothetical protein
MTKHKTEDEEEQREAQNARVIDDGSNFFSRKDCQGNDHQAAANDVENKKDYRQQTTDRKETQR